MLNSSRKNFSGFTLIEAIVYVAVFSLLVGATTTFLINIIQLKNKTQAERTAYQEARFIMERINNRIRLAPGIDTGTSIFDNDQGRLVLKSPQVPTNLTTFYVQNGVAYEKLGAAVATSISSSEVSVSQLNFNQIVSSDLQSSIETKITVSTIGTRPDTQATSALTSHASLRNDYPYEWAQTDWTGGGGQAAWSDVTKYSWDNSDVDVGSCEGDVRLGTNKNEIVIHVSDVCDVNGFFHHAAYASSPEQIRIEDTPDQGMRVGGHFGNAADTDPENYFDVSFNAHANTTYHVWMRGRVATVGDAGTSDSMYIQFSDSNRVSDGAPINRIGTSQGLIPSDFTKFDWKWDDIWTGVTTEGERFRLANEGAHTIRVQRREDGMAIDQIVISSGIYVGSSSRPAMNAVLNRNYAAAAIIESSAFDTGAPSVFGQISWDAYTPNNTMVLMQLRTASDQAGLAAESWQGPTGPADFYQTRGAGINYVHDGDQWIQYRLYLNSTDAQVTPQLSEISISYSN